MDVQRKSETNGRRLLTHLDGSYRSYRSSGYSGTNGASLRQGGSTRGCYPRDCKVPPCGKPWGSQVTSSMEKTGKEKPRSERSDLSHMLHGAGIFTHIWMVFFVFSSGLGNQIQLIQLLATAQGPGHPTEHLGSQTLWRESWDNFDITSWLVKWLKWLHTILFKHKKFSVELISVDSPWFTNQFPKNSTPTPKPPIRSYQAPKRFPLLWWIFWGNSSDWPALCVAQLRHLRACW